jgi:Cd2+/Zn2+-exporting ATPase
MYYTPVVVVLAAVLAVAPPLLFDASWSSWVYRALVLLVIACPCALVISTPVSIVAAISTAARNGVLIKGGAYLEAAGSLRAIAFDKTGTLTRGAPEISAIVPFGTVSETALLSLAASVEQYSEHPLGEAIVAAARARDLDLPAVNAADVRAHVGRGIEAPVNGERVRVGTRALVLDGVTDPRADAELAALEAVGQTAVLVGRGDAVLGVIGLADQLRPEASLAIRDLRSAGIRHMYMLTGDRRAVAETIATTVGFDAVRAELLPDQKVETIESLLRTHGQVGMVGDGINDAPALARSTIGIAMGAAGTSTALETADIALMSDDLSKLAFTIRLSRSAKRVIAQNIGFALAIKLVFLALAIGGTATLWEAIVADVGASLLVVANGMRLLRQTDAGVTRSSALPSGARTTTSVRESSIAD